MAGGMGEAKMIAIYRKRPDSAIERRVFEDKLGVFPVMARAGSRERACQPLAWLESLRVSCGSRTGRHSLTESGFKSTGAASAGQQRRKFPCPNLNLLFSASRDDQALNHSPRRFLRNPALPGFLHEPGDHYGLAFGIDRGGLGK